MVPISVTGVHNCLSNCFITVEEAWAPSVLPSHLDFGKPSPAQMRSLSCVLTCICLLPWFPRSLSFICAPILTQAPLMEIPLAGGVECLWQFVDRGNSFVLNVCEKCKGKIKHANDACCSRLRQWSTRRFFRPLWSVFVCYSSQLYA